MTRREQIIEVLSMLASKEEQLQYEKSVPIADVPAELLCWWFDDLHECWRSAEFPQHERDRIEAFNQFYEARWKKLPGTLREMHESNVWNEIVCEAQAVLKDLGWNKPQAEDCN